MKIKEIKTNRNKYMDLLYLADEDINMINKYIEKGRMFIFYEKEIIGQVLIVKISNKVYEIKNISVYEKFQNKGYGKKIIEFVFYLYKDIASIIMIGTGESRKQLSFYINLGFKPYMRKKDFFINNYSEPIYEEGKKLKDMIYLKKLL